MVKFNKETTKLIREWLAKNDFYCSCRLGRCFQYEPTDEYIELPKIYNDANLEIDSVFMKWLRAYGLKTDFDALTMSILHELGHAETLLDFFDDDDRLNDSMMIELLRVSDNDYYDDLWVYWCLPTEKIANLWAIMWANENPEQTQELEDILASTMEVM